MFLDEFTQVLADCVTEDTNNIVMGDLNIHLNDDGNYDAEVLRDTMYALGLTQHVDFYTHIAGNILDVIITEAGSTIKVTMCEPGPFISDHRAIVSEFSIPREVITTQTSSFRKLSNINVQQMQQDLSQIEISENITDIDLIVQEIEEQFKKVMDMHAPVQTKKLTHRKKYPWFSDSVKEQKQKVRCRERVWKKYLTEPTLTALKIERAKYNNMLKQEKIKTLSEKVQECESNIKKLYKLVSEITGTTMDNPLPKGESDEDLANQFSEFFMNKILNTRNSLEGYPLFKATNSSNTVSFNSFEPLTEKEVTEIINSMATKSCESDIIPTTVLKNSLPGVITNITKIVNISLTEGKFPNNWKVAIIRPLLNKTQGSNAHL